MIVFAYSCLRRELGSLLKHPPNPGEGPNPGGVHRMRVAARRLRVALRLFKDLLPVEAAALRKELRWFARSLAELRDLDVHADELRAYRQDVPSEHLQELDSYERHLQRTRSEAHNGLVALLSDRRYQALVAALEDLVAGETTARPSLSLRIDDAARATLEHSVRRVLKCGASIDAKPSARRLHRLRIKVKQLRYELEFFATVYPPLAKSAYAAKRLQDVLGEHQDACTACTRLTDYLDDHDDGAAPALERLLESQERKAADTRRVFTAEWRRFKKSLSLDELRTLLAA